MMKVTLCDRILFFCVAWALLLSQSFGGVLLVDWLEFSERGSEWIARDDSARAQLNATFSIDSGELTPGFPRSNTLGTDWINAPPVEPTHGNPSLPTFRFQVAGLGSEVDYGVVLTLPDVPPSGIVLAIGQMYGTGFGEREMAIEIVGSDQLLLLDYSMWDNGLERFVEPLRWDNDSQRLLYDSQQAGNSVFAFFHIPGSSSEIEIGLSDANNLDGAGDIVEIAIGIAVPEPSSSLLLLLGLLCLGSLRYRPHSTRLIPVSVS